MSQPAEISTTIAALSTGDVAAADRLMPLVYDELRALAQRYLSAGRAGHTLQATAVINEVYLKLAGASQNTWESRAHFFAVAAKALRQVLADYARRRKSQKRGGGRDRTTLSGLADPAGPSEMAESGPLDLIDLDRALTKLSEIDARQARVVELRFLAGLSVDETAHVLGLGARTVEREWLVAKAWLRRELSGEAT